MNAFEPHRPPAEMLTFILDNMESHVAPRLGKLLVRGRPPISTPTYAVSTSRGVVPHLTQDIIQKHTSIPAVYIGLEDFIERSGQDAPIFKHSKEDMLRSFVSLPEQCLSILGPRRLPYVPSAQSNTASSIGISTSVGFSSLTNENYIRATSFLKPDISISLADLFTTDKMSKKRIAKSADRTHTWLRDKLNTNLTKSTTFASILPMEAEQQSFYLSDLNNEYAEKVQGLCLYHPESTAILPQSLNGVAKLCLNEPESPHGILHAVALGVDMVTVPFVTSASEAGIAFSFQFAVTPNIDSSGSPQGKTPLGTDMWSSEYATDVSALSEKCQCYACKRHHRAYVHHLLQAREMLAWTLIQIHNYHTIHTFFAQIRHSISDGTFDASCKVFEQIYENFMPKQTGEGPRIRGYQMRSIGGGEPKKNTKAYGKLDEQARKIEEAENGVARPTADEDSKALEEHGFAQKI